MAKEKMYVLVEFPYPSGSGLHIGHAFTFTGADVYARFQRMLAKMCYSRWAGMPLACLPKTTPCAPDANPQDVTARKHPDLRRQMEETGLLFRLGAPGRYHRPKYYKWTQWIFIKLLRRAWPKSRRCPLTGAHPAKWAWPTKKWSKGAASAAEPKPPAARISQWVVKITPTPTA
jgi:leucyl-tRNA synthetase